MVDIKKKIRPGAIQLHAEEAALLVLYEVQEVATGSDGSQDVISSSQATKKITVKSLSERTDLQALAVEIVEKCKLIHPSKTAVVQGLLQQLQRRELGLPPPAPPTAPSHAAKSPPSTSSSSNGYSNSNGYSSGHVMPQQQQQPPPPLLQAAAASSALNNNSIRPQSAARPSSPGPAVEGGASASRPASARPHSASRPHTANSSGSSRGSTPHHQQQQQRHQQHSHLHSPQQQKQQQLPPHQQYRVLQASEAFQLYAQALTKSARPAFLDDVEVYLEGLYEEDLPQRAAAADMLCQLFRNSNSMQLLLSRETLLSTLARLLREDGPRSLDMATAVAGCFFACSCVKNLHRQLLDNQVGSLLMDLVSLELQRSAAREAQEGPGTSPAAIATKAAASAAAAVPGSGGRGGGSSSSKAATRKQPPQLDQREFRLLSVLVNQDRFLCIALATLLNLAEEPSVQRKMVKKDITGLLLLALMTRPHLEVLLVVVGFLRRLCVFAESKARLSAHPSLVPHLVSLLQPGCGEQLQSGVLRLLHNLSFDGALRQQMMAAGLVQQTVPLLDGAHTSPLAAGLLYQLSLCDEACTAFCFCPGGLPRLLDSILRALGGPSSSNTGPTNSSCASGGLRTIPELIALAVNVAHSRNAAEWFAAGERLERLTQRALVTGDELAWKLLRNLAVSGGALVAPALLARADGMLGILQSHNTGPELFVEVLGTLATAADAVAGSSGGGSGGSSSEAAPWTHMEEVSLQDLLAFLAGCFQQGDHLEDDALLETVVLLGALAGWTEGQNDLADSGLLHQLVDLLPAKRADDEFVLQVCWAIRRAFMQPATTNALLSHDQVVMYLVDLVHHDACVAVRRVAGSCLDVVLDLSEDMAGAIRGLKFEAFNQEWLQMVGGEEAQQIMAKGASQQQQQLQLYIHQQQLQQQLQLEHAATPYSTLAAEEEYEQCSPDEQQQPRRAVRRPVNGYFYEQQQQQSDLHVTQQCYPDGFTQGQQQPWGFAGFDEQQQEEAEQEQQQLQWMSWPASGEGEADTQQQGGQQLQEEGGGRGSISSCTTITRPSIVTAGGQRMVLDFDAYVSDAGGV